MSDDAPILRPPEATTVPDAPRVVLYDCYGRPLVRRIGFLSEREMSKKGKGKGKGKGC